MKRIGYTLLLIALLCTALWCAAAEDWQIAIFFGALYAVASFGLRNYQ